MKKSIKKNLYAAVDVMAVVTLLLLVAFVAKKEKKVGVAFGVMGAATFITMVTQMMFGQSKIENRCPEIIYTKSENGCDAVELDLGQERYDIDGVKSRGVVYKLVDGCHGIAKKDGTVKVKSFTGKFINSVRGGVLTTPPDECWRTLFEA